MRNSLDRDKVIKTFGKEKAEKLFQTDSHYKKYREPPIPKKYVWLFEHFMYIWNNCTRDFNGNVNFSFFEINEYEKCMKVTFSLVEKKILFMMKQWANEVIMSF